MANTRNAKMCQDSAPPAPIFLTIGEVVDRYRGQIGDGTLRNWRTKGIGPSYVKAGKAILYRVTDLENWERRNAVKCAGAIE
jgi:hypothetical protein